MKGELDNTIAAFTAAVGNRADAGGAVWHADVRGAAGPVTLVELARAIEEKRLMRTSRVWRQGMANWIAAGEVPELAPLFDAVVPERPNAALFDLVAKAMESGTKVDGAPALPDDDESGHDSDPPPLVSPVITAAVPALAALPVVKEPEEAAPVPGAVAVTAAPARSMTLALAVVVGIVFVVVVAAVVVVALTVARRPASAAPAVVWNDGVAYLVDPASGTLHPLRVDGASQPSTDAPIKDAPAVVSSSATASARATPPSVAPPSATGHTPVDANGATSSAPAAKPTSTTTAPPTTPPTTPPATPPTTTGAGSKRTTAPSSNPPPSADDEASAAPAKREPPPVARNAQGEPCDPVLDFDCPPPKKAGLTQEQILAVVKQKLPHLHACGGSVKTLKVGWRILPSGDVADVVVKDKAEAGTPLADCVVGKVASWTFPAAPGDAKVSSFTLPLDR